ncbi:MAG: iron-sulfur cluster-binding protein [Alphaproteobacteria bacterium]|nr:iron-sulfur cluster-binding protein [Alphaproteobacteria bacterium]
MNLDPRRFRENSRAALEDPGLRIALGRLRTHFAAGRAGAVERYPGWEELREQGRAIRDYSLANLDTLLEQFERNMTARGGHVHWARDGAEARHIVLAILQQRNARSIIKGKSMVSEEIGLNPFLEARGIVPVETDLGEYIVQLRREPPSHIIAPAFHLNKEDVTATFRAAHTELPADRSIAERSELVAEARRVLRQHFESANAGITGANFLTAAEGATMLVTNEGNGDLTRLLPKTHIVLTGIEKVVANLEQAAVLLRLLTRSATGQDISSYVTVMSGPRATGETDGPENFHVVLVDNGRTHLLGTQAQEVLRCIRCAACLNHCPVYAAVGGHAYGTTYTGPLGAALNPGTMGLPIAHHHPNASTFCGRCAEVCPVKIPLPKIMRHWRAREYASSVAPASARRGLRLWAFFARRPALYRVAAKTVSRVLRLFACDGRVRTLPLFRDWFAVRDFPAPHGRTFQELWTARK